MAFIAADSYHSTIASIAGGTGITSFTLTSASGFPALAAGDFTIMRLDDGGTPENVICTAISGVTVTCLATGSAHAAGNTIDGPILTAGALAQTKEDAHSGFPVNAFSAAGALVKGTGIRNHGTVTVANCTMTLADGSYKGELCRVSIDRTSTKQVTVDPASTTLWDGAATIALFAGDNIIGAWDGTGWTTLAKFSSFKSQLQSYIANNFYLAFPGITSNAQTSAYVTTTTRWTPFWVTTPITISQLGARVGVGNTGNFQLAVYASGADNYPTGSPLVTTASLSTAAPGVVMGTASLSILVPGLYWIGTQCDNITATFNASSVSTSLASPMIGCANSVNLFSGNTTLGTTWNTTGGTFGTWPPNPAMTEANIATAQVLAPIIKIASVP